MVWVCRNCGKEHAAARTSCKRCESREIEYASRETNTVSVGGKHATDPIDDPEYESSPDVRTDGSLDGPKKSEPASESKGRRLQSRISSSSRSGIYSIRAWILAPFHIIWMYKQAILAFLIVFGGVYFILF